jgi:hypothetical protein
MQIQYVTLQKLCNFQRELIVNENNATNALHIAQTKKGKKSVLLPVPRCCAVGNWMVAFAGCHAHARGVAQQRVRGHERGRARFCAVWGVCWFLASGFRWLSCGRGTHARGVAQQRVRGHERGRARFCAVWGRVLVFGKWLSLVVMRSGYACTRCCAAARAWA